MQALTIILLTFLDETVMWYHLSALPFFLDGMKINITITCVGLYHKWIHCWRVYQAQQGVNMLPTFKSSMDALGWVVLDQHYLCLLSSCQWWSGNVKIPSTLAQMAAVISRTPATMSPEHPSFKPWGSTTVIGVSADKIKRQLPPRIIWSCAKDQWGMVKSWQLTGANDVTLGTE